MAASRPIRSGAEDSAKSGSVILQFLSLYLLVLAFFILLVSISTFETVKSSAVMDSLNSTFAPVLPPTRDLTVFTSRSGRVFGHQEFQNEVENLFATTLGVEKIEVVQPGRLMRVTMLANAIFHDDTTEIRAAQVPLMDRMIASLSGRPPGFHFDMEFVIGTNAARDGTLPSAQTLEMARAGKFVREMLARGVPPDTISIGMRRDDPSRVVMWFYVRPPEEVESYYDQLRNTVINELPSTPDVDPFSTEPDTGDGG